MVWLDRRRMLISGAALASGLASARSEADVSPVQAYFEGRYLPRYLDLREKAESGDERSKALLRQYASFLSDEETALGDERARPLSATLPDLSQADARDALEIIAERAVDKRVVVLNEAHNVSGHRAFLADVLRTLRPLGFNVLAAEAFSMHDEGIASYGVGRPFRMTYGFYTSDPAFAEAVREAARLGYRFARYEQKAEQAAVEGASPMERIAAREAAQAANMKSVLDADPEAKVLVYVGYNHILETPNASAEWFVSRLKASTGLDPLTIEQSANWPALTPEQDRTHVHAVLTRFQPVRPIAVFQEGAAFAAQPYTGRVDLSIFHPRRPAVAGRPGWLAAAQGRRPFEVALPRLSRLAILQASPVDEGENVVPSDQTFVRPGSTSATLFLLPGRFRVRIEHETGFIPLIEPAIVG